MTILAGHAGWPWVLEMVTVAWRHPNVFVEVSAFRPQNMSEPGYGFESLVYFGKGPLQDKVMFGSTWNLLNLPMRQIFDEVRGLPIPPRVADKWLHHNAARIFRLD
jgi:predicted TIM-barrel fold metal-dependent hydrolase